MILLSVRDSLLYLFQHETPCMISLSFKNYLFSIIDLSNRKKPQENGNLYQDISIYLTSPNDDNLRSSARNVPICGQTEQKPAIIVEVFPEDDAKTAKVTYPYFSLE